MGSAAHVGTDNRGVDKAVFLHIRNAEYFTHWAVMGLKMQKRVQDSTSHFTVTQENDHMTTDEDEVFS